MSIRCLGTVRADGRLYCLVDLGRMEPLDGAVPAVEAQIDGRRLPVELHPAEGEPAGAWVVVLPYFPKSVIQVTVSVPDASASLTVNTALARWKSSFNYRARRDLVDRVSGVQDRWTHNRFRPVLERYLAGDGCDIWRVSVTWDGSASAEPRLRVVGEDAREVDAAVHPFERQSGVETDWGGTASRWYYSVAAPSGCRHFAVEAFDEAGLVRPGFCSCDERFWKHQEYVSWLRMRDARADDERYRAWFEKHRAHRGDLASQAAQVFDYAPLISIVVPCFNSDRGFLTELIESVRAQSYGSWELLLVDASPQDATVAELAAAADDSRIRLVRVGENRGIVGNTNAGVDAAAGEYAAFLDHDDLLEPDALYRYVSALNTGGRADVLFCDEDLFSERGRWRQPVFKTALNLDLLLSHNCVTHFLCVRTAFLRMIGLSSEDVAGAQDYDVVLRAQASGGRIEHVPHVLYHWREHAGSTSGDNADSKPYAERAGQVALERYLGMRGIAGSVEVTEHPFVYRVRYELPDPLPCASVVIPSRDHADVLRTCVTSLFETATYPNFEVVVVENGSEEAQTFALYRELSAAYGDRFRVVDASEQIDGFNYACLINIGARAARGEYLLLLNNDTKVITPCFIEEMMGYLMRPEVGVVGAKLYFRDGLTQHAGVLVGPYDAVAHCNQDFPRERAGYLARAVRPGNFSAVTGACQMMRRSTFDEVGGYDESFAVGFNDIDFCFRVREAGKLVVFTPYAELYHFEFTSRGRESADRAKLDRWERERGLFMRRWPSVFTEGDPFTNPNLDRNSAYYGL